MTGQDAGQKPQRCPGVFRIQRPARRLKTREPLPLDDRFFAFHLDGNAKGPQAVDGTHHIPPRGEVVNYSQAASERPQEQRPMGDRLVTRYPDLALDTLGLLNYLVH